MEDDRTVRIDEMSLTTSGSIDAAAAAHLFDFVPDTLFYVKGTAGTWLACNQRTLSFLNARSIDELRGKSELDLFPRAVAEAVRSDDHRVIGRGETIVDRIETLIDPVGAMVWARTTKLPIRDATGAAAGLIGITRLLDDEASSLPCPELRPVITFIEAHFREPIRVARLAGLASVSVAGLRSRFHRHFSLSPHQFVVRRRMQAAAALLRGTTMPRGDRGRLRLLRPESVHAAVLDLFRLVPEALPRPVAPRKPLRFVLRLSSFGARTGFLLILF